MIKFLFAEAFQTSWRLNLSLQTCSLKFKSALHGILKFRRREILKFNAKSMARRISSLKFRRVNFDRSLLCVAYLCAQASARLSGKCSYASSPPFFRTSKRERRAICGIIFDVDTAQKLLLEMGTTNRCRRSACFIGSRTSV